MKLRCYQNDAAAAIETQWETFTSTMVSMATGLGKTVLFADIIRRRQPGRSLVIAHRRELIDQARDKIERVTGLQCEIEMADQVAEHSLFHRLPIVIASIQTLVSGKGGKRRVERFDPMAFSTVIIDEFHHATSDGYRAVLNYFKDGNPDIKILGVTATPDRSDKEALGQVCESVAYKLEIEAGIDLGFLVPIRQQCVTIEGLDFSSVRTTAGDLNGGDLAAIMEQEKNVQGMCSAALEIIGTQQTVMFCASVAQAQAAANVFNRHKEGVADWVCGKTDKAQRAKTMAKVYDGSLQIIVNCGVLTEGFDAPGIKVIIMGRPTKSRSLYAQMAGRATRPLPGTVDGLDDTSPEIRRSAILSSAKPDALIIDFVGNSGKHKLVCALDILGGEFTLEEVDLATLHMKEDGGAKSISMALQEARAELAEKRRAEEEHQEQLAEAKRLRLVAKAAFKAKSVNPFDSADIARDVESERLHRQRAGLCSPKQAALLNRYGFDGASIKRAEAGRLIDAISSNGWHKPEGLAVQVAAPKAAPSPNVNMVPMDDWL